jgi:beta-lactamase class A
MLAMICTGLPLAAAVLALGACQTMPGADRTDSNVPRPLQSTLDRLGAEAAWRTPGSQVALAVVDLESGERAEVAGDELFVSASAAKAWWVAAALAGTDVDRVAPFAAPVFAGSDNAATGAVIDLVGPDRVNRFLWDVVAMRSTALTRWNHGARREATGAPRRMGEDNYTTARDALRFLERLARGEILDRARTRALLDWMRLSPRAGLGGWLTARLPPHPRAGAAHKAGWLEPGCCSDERTYNHLNEIGVVRAAGRRYAVVILTHAGHDFWGKQTRFVEYASCEIYRAVARDASLRCDRADDPIGPAQARNASSANASAGMSQASAMTSRSMATSRQ